MTEQNSGLVDLPIVVKAYPNEMVIIEHGRPIRFYGAKWWIIEGLHFRQAQYEYIRLGSHEALGDELTVAAEHIVIRNCEFGNGKYAVIPIFYGNDILIEDNHFHDIRVGVPFSQDGREVNAVVVKYIADNIVIRNNRFEDIGSDGVHIGSQSYLPGSDIGAIELTDNEFFVNRPYSGILGNV
ncbi:MAG: right-handed parallel beta-helix repeat-containing protein, partial [Planctomycetes bacterium]|nr:right-handed parallel beta-helix repeat-containing protein [Planctomycetota bacterium]